MLLYSGRPSPRLSYITAFVGVELFGKPIELTTNKGEFISYDGPKVNYSDNTVSPGEFKITNVELLFENDIKDQPIECSTGEHMFFFKTSSGDFPFDLFAASFYLISRYEEYLEHRPDQYGRYSHTNSLAYNEGFLHLPLVNLWIQQLKKALRARYPSLEFNLRKFTFLPTYDIDMAYSYLAKGWWRNFGGFSRSLLKGEWGRLPERISVLLNKQRDPFDSYEWLDQIHSGLALEPRYFFLMAEKQKAYDKNIPPSSLLSRKLVKHHSAHYNIGIHPSWQSGDSATLLKKEIRSLEIITGKRVEHSRQHYLRFKLPSTYRNLLREGINKEYSMGYGSVTGFRASVASSFNWYDLQKEESTPLQVYPFCFMDATAYYHQKLSPLTAYEELIKYLDIIKAVNGLMITIWHNDFLGTDKKVEGWRDIYQQFLGLIPR